MEIDGEKLGIDKDASGDDDEEDCFIGDNDDDDFGDIIRVPPTDLNELSTHMETVSWKLVIDHSDALGRAGCASVVYKDRYVLIFGGRAKSLFFIDCLSLDTATGDLHPLNPHTTHTSGYNNSKISPRAHHSATIIGDTAWIIGGGNETELVEDAIACFYITNKKWTVPSMQGELHLLKRTAHGACIHPLKPSCILLFGGYTSCNDKDKGQWLQDLVLINTKTLHVSSVRPEGPLPTPRAYHSFTAVQSLCISLFGRTASASLISSREAPAIYDAAANKWILSEKASGNAPAARASHRACAVSGGVVVYGGAPARSTQARLSDLRFLTVEMDSRPSDNDEHHRGGLQLTLKWSPRYHVENGAAIAHDEYDDDDVIDSLSHPGIHASKHAHKPAGRAAHVLECVGDRVYVLAGYGDEKKYAADAWCVDIHSKKSSDAKKHVRLPDHNTDGVDAPPLPLHANGTMAANTVAPGNATTATNEAAGHVSPQWRALKRQHPHTLDDSTGHHPIVVDGQQQKRVKESVPKAHPMSGVLAMALSHQEDSMPSPTGKQLSSSLLQQSPQKQQPVRHERAWLSQKDVDDAAISKATRKQLTHIAQLEQQVYDLQQAIGRQATNEQSIMLEKKKLEDDLQARTIELKQREKEINEARADCIKWKKLLEEHRALLAKALETGRVDVHAIKKEKESQLRAARAELQREISAKRSTEEENSRLLRQVEDMQGSLVEERTTSDRLRDQHASLLQQNNTLQQQLAVTAHNSVGLQTELDRIKAESSMLTSALREEKQRTEKELAMVKERLNTSLEEGIKHRHHRTSLETELRLNEDELARVKARLNRERDSRDELEGKLKKLSDDIDAVTSEKNTLVKTVASERARNQRNLAAVKDVVHRWHGSGGMDG